MLIIIKNCDFVKRESGNFRRDYSIECADNGDEVTRNNFYMIVARE